MIIIYDNASHFHLRCVSFGILKMHWLRIHRDRAYSNLSNFAPCVFVREPFKRAIKFQICYTFCSVPESMRCRQISIISIFKIKLRSIMRKFWTTSKQWHKLRHSHSHSHRAQLPSIFKIYYCYATLCAHPMVNTHIGVVTVLKFCCGQKTRNEFTVAFYHASWILARSQLFQNVYDSLSVYLSE